MRRGKELGHPVEREFQWEQILLHLLQPPPSLVLTIPFMMEKYLGFATHKKTLIGNLCATEPLFRGTHTDMDLSWGTPLPRLHSLVMA